MPRRPRDPGVPQSPADYFGDELRAHRELAGLSRPQLAETLGYTPQWIGQIEQHQSVPSEDFAKDCDTFFQTNGTFYRIWQWIKKAVRIKILPPGFSDFLEWESAASKIHIFESMVITGLFQTPEYAYELLKSGRTAEETEQVVATRIERQAVLRGEDPCHIVALFDEGAIRRPIGSAETMREQIRHLIETAELPNVTLQIIPSSRGAYAGLPGAFMIFGLLDDPDVVHVEGHVGTHLIDHADTVSRYEVRFDLIRGVAMCTDDSLALLRSILESL
jgi:transcriptional regulator with XRE-family HTH domain